MYCCDYVVMIYCCDDVLFWLCIVVVMHGCGDVLLWWCIVVMMYCCNDVLLRWCIRVIMYCCSYVIMCCCHIFTVRITELLNFLWWYMNMIEGSLEVKLPTIWTDEKAEQGRGREKRKIRRQKSRRQRVRRKKMQMREKVGKSRNTVFFQWFVAPEGRTVGSLKRRVRSQLARWEMKNCTPLWREAHFQVKMHKTHHGRTTFGSWDVEKVHAVVARSILTHQLRTTFGSWDVEKVHAVVARSTFPGQNVQNTPAPDHFWKLRCGKSARRCGAKHISKRKCTKHHMFVPLLEVPMWKKCTPLWREAHFEVKMLKTPGVRTTFGGSGVASLHYTTLHYTTLHYITLHYTPLHSTTLHYTPLHSTTLHYTKLHFTTLHYTTLHYTTLHYITLPYTTFHYTSLHYTPLRYNYNYNFQ